jgi:hypothetical protein
MGKKQKNRAFRQRTLHAAMSTMGMVSGEGVASAVYVNDDGLGDALIYPYYTVRRGAQTQLVDPEPPIRSTYWFVPQQVSPKAVQVRYLDRPTPNADEVRDFNLFLSPRDVWTRAVESAQGLESVVRHVSPGVLAQAALDSLAALDDRPQIAVVNGTHTRDWIVYLGVDPPAGEARIREGYVELVEMGSSRHLEQYPRDLRQIALFGLQTLPFDDREEFLHNISQSAVIADPSEGPQDGYFHPESILGRPRSPRQVNQHLVRGSRGRNRGAKR